MGLTTLEPLVSCGLAGVSRSFAMPRRIGFALPPERAADPDEAEPFGAANLPGAPGRFGPVAGFGAVDRLGAAAADCEAAEWAAAGCVEAEWPAAAGCAAGDLAAGFGTGLLAFLSDFRAISFL
jgi:hypothetical protein